MVPIKILFVDDDPSLLSALRRSLRRYRDEWKISFANHGREAFEILQQEPIEIIVSDVRMPEIDGAQLLSEVSARYPHIVRFVLSGQAEKIKINRLVGAAHQYYAKPCETSELHASVSRIVEKRRPIADDQMRVLNGLPSIPCRRQSMSRLSAIYENDSPNLDELAQLIADDLGLSCKVLQIVNSSFFGPARIVESVQSACKMLGVDLLNDILLNSGAVECWQDNVPNDQLTLLRELDESSLTREVLANFLSSGNVTCSGSSSPAVPVLDFLFALWGIRAATVQELPTHPSTGVAALPLSLDATEGAVGG